MKKLSELSAKARLLALVACARELNDECGFDDPIETKGASEKELKKLLEEAGGLLNVDDKLTDKSNAVLGELGYLSKEYKSTIEEEEEEDVEELDLMEVVQSTKTLKDLKELVEEEDVFEDLVDGLDKHKRPAALKKEMIALLEDEEEEEEEEKPAKSKRGKKVKSEPEEEEEDEDEDEEEEEEEEEEEPAKSKRGRKGSTKKESAKKVPSKKKGGLSNKAKVYKEWARKKKKPTADELHEFVDGEVKVTTIRSWTSSWGRGEKLPAGVEV